MQPDAFGQDKLILDVEKWYVRLMTKRDALRQSTTRVYFIGDLLMTIPNFTGAPGFDLNEALSNTSSGGSNGGGGGNGGQNPLFGGTETDDSEYVPTKEEKADQIMDMIRTSIEPDIWQANGGEYASMRFMRNMIVVKAPDFVHEQIGVPFGGHKTRSTKGSRTNHASGDRERNKIDPKKISGNVAGKAPESPRID